MILTCTTAEKVLVTAPATITETEVLVGSGTIDTGAGDDSKYLISPTYAGTTLYRLSTATETTTVALVATGADPDVVPQVPATPPVTRGPMEIEPSAPEPE